MPRLEAAPAHWRCLRRRESAGLLDAGLSVTDWTTPPTATVIRPSSGAVWPCGWADDPGRRRGVASAFARLMRDVAFDHTLLPVPRNQPRQTRGQPDASAPTVRAPFMFA